jgi:hypothetical protein
MQLCVWLAFNFILQFLYLAGKTGSMTLITALDPTELPFFFDFRMGRNNQFNFLVVVLEACKRGYLKRGDYLVMDNAAIHSGNDILGAISISKSISCSRR